MNLDDLNEAPMGIMNKLGQKVLSKVPGSLGATAKGKLTTGTVANKWKNQYMQWLGASGQQPTAKTIMAFFKNQKKLSPQLIGRALGSLKVSEATERVYTRRELDQIMMKMAQGAAAGDQGKSIQRSQPEPDLIQKVQHGLTKTVPDTGTTPQQPTAAPVQAQPTANQPGIIQKVAGAAKKAFAKQLPKQRIEPSMGTPLPRSMPSLTPTLSTQKKFVPYRKAPKMKESIYLNRDEFEKILDQITNEGFTLEDLGFKIDLIESTTVVLRRTEDQTS